VATESKKQAPKTWSDRLQQIDVRYVYLLMFIVISVPVLRPMGIPLGTISEESRRLYNYIDALPARSIVVMINDNSPAAAAECHPGMLAIYKHCVTKGLRVLFYASRTDAVPYTEMAMQEILGSTQNHPSYGKLVVNLGYIPQTEVGLAALAANAFYTNVDAYGRTLRTMEFYADLPDTTAHSWRLAIYYGASSVDWVVRQVTDVYPECKTAGSVAAVLSTRLIPYYPHSIIGFLNGLRGSAEYEVLVGRPGEAAAGMDAQSLGHLAIVITIIVGNIGYFASRAKGGKEK